MAVTDQQKLDFLLKKIGYTKTKTGNVDGTGNPGEGSVKQPFAEAIPSPLVVPNSSLWNEADSIPATPPGSDTTQVKVYSASSAVRLTEDITVSTASQARSWIAYSTYNNTSSARLTNWIDTQFGAGYLIKVYSGDPNSGGTPLSAGATNENWFFDYSAGVLNFNDDTCPVSPSDSIYIVGYRYIGQTGAPTSGISTFSHLDLTVERNLDVGKQGGISTFRNNIDLNADLDVDGHTNLDNVSVAGVSTFAGDIVIADNIVHSGDGDTKIRFPDNNEISFHTGGVQRLKIHSDGKFSFGHDNPSAYYDFEGPATSGKLHLADFVNVGQNTLELNMYGSADLVQFAAINGEQNISIVTENVNSVSATTSKGIYIKSGGNVGINNVSPTEKLDVTGNIKAMGLCHSVQGTAEMLAKDLEGDRREGAKKMYEAMDRLEAQA